MRQLVTICPLTSLVKAAEVFFSELVRQMFQMLGCSACGYSDAKCSLMPYLLVFALIVGSFQLPLGYAQRQATSSESCNVNTPFSEAIMDWQLINNRCVGLLFAISPFRIANTTTPVSLNFTLYDPVNATTKFTYNTFNITIWNSLNNSIDFQETYRSQNNRLVLTFQPDYQKQLHSYIPTNATTNGVARSNSPIFSNGGYFHVRTQLLAVNNSAINPASYDRYFTIGTSYPIKFIYDNKANNATIISYGNRIAGISFDNNTKSFGWTMPFEHGNASYSHPIVHEEIWLPVDFYNAYLRSNNVFAYNATVNGASLSSRNVIVDPFAFQNVVIFHYVIGGKDISQDLDRNGTTIQSLTFGLSPMVAMPEYGYVAAPLVLSIAAVILLSKRRSLPH